MAPSKSSLLDGYRTSSDWQTHPGEICVLPVGSMEQHDGHLPLLTDTLQATHYAQMVAKGLNAALLPALPFGTSMEHTGFRGSFSLRPETAMAIIRDLASEVERQRFRFLIIVNGHGGNFSYGPVVRDHNRMDRVLKIILFDPWSFAPSGIADKGGADLHGGEFETSVMLATHPELVGECRDTFKPPTCEEIPLQRSDLNTFGFGHMNTCGSVGFPSFATAEKGRALLKGIEPKMLAFLRDRIRRLKEQPKYAGAGGIAVRTMIERDLPDGMRLKSLAGWNQTEADWNRFLKTSPTGCFVAVRDGSVLGSSATIRYGSGASQVAWISMVLVDPDVRRAGLGTRLLDRAIEHLADCPSVKLDATPAGRELYLKRGFTDERRLTRWACSSVPVIQETRSSEITSVGLAQPSVLEALDREVTGLSRADLLQALREGAPQLAWKSTRAGKASGFVLGRPGTNAWQIGPVIAADPLDARALITAALQSCIGRAVFIDVFDAQADTTAWLQSLGFLAQRPLIRMWKGSPGPTGVPARDVAIVGPEFG